MKQHFLGWFCRWLNDRGILTHPKPGQHDPCRSITEYVEAWRIIPRWLIIWRVRRTLSIVYATQTYTRMTFKSAKSYDRTMPARGLRWHVVFDTNCTWRGNP